MKADEVWLATKVVAPIVVGATLGILALLWWAPTEGGTEFYSAAAGLIPVLLLTFAVQQGATARVRRYRDSSEPFLGWAAAQVRRAGAVLALAALIGAELCAIYTLAKGNYDDLPFFREPNVMFAAVAFGLGIIGTIALEPRTAQEVRVIERVIEQTGPPAGAW